MLIIFYSTEKVPFQVAVFFDPLIYDILKGSCTDCCSEIMVFEVSCRLTCIVI